MNLTTIPAIPAMTPAAIAEVAAYQAQALQQPQIAIHTQHILHAGLYSRTIKIPAGVELIGALIKRSTLLMVSGDVLVNRGEGEAVRMTGTFVLPASAGRKQVFGTFADTVVTMTFATAARTIEEAEAEFTDETELLFSHRDPELNTIIITGE